MFALGHGEPGFLVDVGHTYGNAAHLPGGVPVHHGSGYDGQFMYRLARDPFDLRINASGIRLDNAFRLGRIGYPLIVWLVSAGGRASAVPVALLVVSIASLAALAALGAVEAERFGLAWGWGLLVCWPGLLFSVDFDLAEPLEVLLVVGGLMALQRGHTGWATAALAFAVLTRETALVAVLAVAVWRLPQLIRRRRPESADLAWAVPVAVFAGWQLVCHAATGRFPLTSDAGSNAQSPFSGIAAAWSSWVRIAHRHPYEAALHAAELLILVIVVFAALGTVLNRALARRKASPSAESGSLWNPWVIATVLGVASACCLSVAVWASSSDLRMFSDVYAFAALILLAGRPSRAALSTWAIGLAGLATAVTVYWTQVA
jgi:hypothetical protein